MTTPPKTKSAKSSNPETTPAKSKTAEGDQPRFKVVKTFTNAEVGQMAKLFLNTDYSEIRSAVIELLYEFVSLTDVSLMSLLSEMCSLTSKLESFQRLLRKYKHDGLVLDVSRVTRRQAIRSGLSSAHSKNVLRAYRLGPVGEEYARHKGWSNAPLVSMGEDRLTHDLVCAEAMCQMRVLWPHIKNPGIADIHGPRKVSAWDGEKKAFIVSPDGLIIKKGLDGTFQRAFLIEYHHTDWAINVQNKVKKYEEIGSPEYRWLWQGAWGVSEMPWVVGLYRHATIPQYYKDEIEKLDSPICNYAVLSLDDVWDGNLMITPVRKTG